MTLKIPEMQYDKSINKAEGKKVLEFSERYLESFNDSTVEMTYDKAMSAGFLGKGQYNILLRRREQFSDDEVNDPEDYYIKKYRKVVSRLIGIDAQPFPNLNTNRIDLPKLKDMLEFFNRQGYLTQKQIKFANYLLRNYPLSQVPHNLSGKIESVLHHHIKKEFMKAKSTTELAEILVDMEKEPKKVIPKKKMFFSLSQIRNELSH